MIWTIPNILTVARIAAAPAMALVLLVLPRPLADQAAFLLFAVAALTDFLDGWLARRLGQISPMGKMLDPIADKAMVAIALALLLAQRGPEPLVVIPAVLILLREVLISGLREYLGDVKLPVTQLAKWKTTGQLVAIGLMLAVPAWGLPDWPGLACLWVAALLTIVTGRDYFRQAMPYLTGGKV